MEFSMSSAAYVYASAAHAVHAAYVYTSAVLA